MHLEKEHPEKSTQREHEASGRSSGAEAPVTVGGQKATLQDAVLQECSLRQKLEPKELEVQMGSWMSRNLPSEANHVR